MEYVTLKQLADELKMDRSHLRRYVLQNDFEPFKVRTAESRGQPTLALSPADAESVRDMRTQDGFTYSVGVPANGGGFFYVIQLLPSLAPNRVKLGFAISIEARLQSHRTAAPTAELIKAWPCKRSWETAAIASVTRIECQLLSGEVFDCESLDTLVSRCDEFFAIMPK